MSVVPEADRPYVCGRPPYGYQVTDKQLHVHPEQSKNVLRIFKLVRAKKSIRFVVEAMQAQEEDRSEQAFWDRKKVSRILMHAPLYCTGAYRVQGQDLELPQLVFLDPTWVNTPGAPPVAPTPPLKLVRVAKPARTARKHPVIVAKRRAAPRPGSVPRRVASGTMAGSRS